jgi:single-strand DNA-binding protein
MANLNKVMLIGNLTRDPELRYTPKGSAVAEFGLAINRVWYNEQKQKQEETTFVDITLWARQAEIAQQYLTKGSPVYIEGRLSLDTWDDKATGQKRSRLKVVGDGLQLLGSKNHSAGGATPAPGGPQASHAPQPRSGPPQGASAAPPDEFQEEDDIPF